LVPYIEGLLDETQERAVKEHVDACQACRAEAEGLQTLQRRLVGDAEVLAERNLEDEVMNRIIREQSVRLKSAPQAGEGLRLRRLIMQSRMAKIVAAAAIVLVCIGGLFLWKGTESGVALADVLAKVEQVQAFMYRMTMHMEGPMQGMPSADMDVDMEGTVLIAEEYGMRMDMYMVDPNGALDLHQQMYMLPRQNMMIMLMPGMKKYMRVEIDETVIEKTRQQNNDPRLMIKQIIACEYEELGKDVIDGIEVEGFRTTDPSYAGSMFGDVAVTLWVDAKTWLPVRVEMDMKMNEEMQMQGTLHDFQWDVPVQASEFDAVIPADYTAGPGDGIKVPAMNEETAIKGLRLARTLTGEYPKNLNMMDLIKIMSQVPKEDEGEAESRFESPDDVSLEDIEAMAAKQVEKFMPIQGLGTFYMMLGQEQKDPAYYGDIATPDDPAHVLMRWKVSETEYRVIFADLHAETVTAEALAELEAALPE
jgi:outer membrane lipoprotein-sorting protein